MFSFIQPHPEGVTIAIRAQPGAKKNAIQGEQNGRLKIAVQAPPEDGRANDAILELLRKSWNLKRSQVDLLTGATHREKVILIRGVTSEEVQQMVKTSSK